MLLCRALVTHLLACLHNKNKSDFFGELAFFQPIRAFWIQFEIALIGWIKVGPPKKPLLLWSCKQAIYIYIYSSYSVTTMLIQFLFAHESKEAYEWAGYSAPPISWKGSESTNNQFWSWLISLKRHILLMMQIESIVGRYVCVCSTRLLSRDGSLLFQNRKQKRHLYHSTTNQNYCT